MLIDHSYLSTYAACPRKHFHRYEENLEPVGGSAPLNAGSALHAGIHALIVHNWDVEKGLEALRAEWGAVTLEDGQEHLTRGHCEIVLRNFCDDHRNTFHVVCNAEGEPYGEMALATELGDGLQYGGKVDLVVQHGGALYVLDWKCTSSWVSETWAKPHKMSHQMRGYVRLVREVLGLPVEGAYIFGVYMGPQAADPPEKWARRKSKRSLLCGPYLWDESHLEETREWAQQWYSMVERSRERGEWPQNAGIQCGWCEFAGLCELPQRKQEIVKLRGFRQRDMSGAIFASGVK